MQKVYGATERFDCLMQIGRRLWELIYGYDTDGATGWTYRERFTRKPSLDEIKDTIIKQVNANTQEKIVNGYSWKGNRVYLSTENQLNFSAIERNTSMLYPMSLKINEQEDGTAIYYTFESAEEFSQFYKDYSLYIFVTLKQGWEEKDNIDWSVFT